MTQATQALERVDGDEEEEKPREKVWGLLISLNPTYPNVELTGFEVVLGRQSCCNVQFNDNLNISGKHCRIFREPSVNGSVIAFIQDMSTNGTFVNNEKLGKGNRMLLSNGFEIALVLNKKKAQDKVAYIFRECAEDKPQEEGGPHKKYDIREALGQGNFAVVKLAINKATGGRFAIKIIDKKKYLNQAGSRKEALMDEVKILQSLNHQNIIHIEEVFDTEKTLYLVLELIEGGDLFGDLTREGHYTEAKARGVFGQIIDAILFLHDRGVAHRDLKPENILIKPHPGKDNEFDVKLSDFGLSRTIGEGSFMKTMCGTPQYLAPEILTNGGVDGYGKEVDMWSAGAILYVLLCGYPPFDDNKSISIFDQIKQGLVDFPDAHWGDVSASAKDLIRRLLTVKPSKRFTAKETKTHPWMLGEDTVSAAYIQAHAREETPPSTPSTKTPPATPSPPQTTPKTLPTDSSFDDGSVGSVINYNKTLNDRNDTPTKQVSTNGDAKNSISSKNSTAVPKNRLLVSLESEKNLQTQLEQTNLGDKRKRNSTSEDEEEDEKGDTPVAPSPPVPKKVKSDNSDEKSDETTKNLKKTGTGINKENDDAKTLKKSGTGITYDDEEEDEKSKGNGKAKSSSSSQVVPDDEEEEEESGGKKGKKKDDRPMCKYGKACYRKNPQHLKDFRHPQK